MTAPPHRPTRLLALAFAAMLAVAGAAGCADQSTSAVVDRSAVADPSATGASGPAQPSPARSGWWRPGPVTSWQWQLTGALDPAVDAAVFEVDAFTTTVDEVDRLHTAGRRVICYVNAGAYEDFRPDARRFPAGVIGRDNGWRGERWLDIRRWDVLEPVLTDRLRMCRDKGFDGVEADNVDGYQNDSGFPLTADDQLGFNRRVAALTHSIGLAAGLKNDLGQGAALQPQFDFAVNEECFRYHECEVLSAFIAAGKPVFHVEYDVRVEDFCPGVRALGFASMRKRLDLDAWRAPC